MKTSAILLAGGRSSRFGSDKAELILEGESLLERTAARLRAVFGEVIVVGRDPGLPGVRHTFDRFPGRGPLGGIHAGLEAAKGELCFVMACDMPFFPETLARQLLTLAEDAQAALPRDGEKLQPLFGVLRKSAALPAAEELLEKDIRPVRRLYEALDARYLDREDWETEGCPNPFFNINCPEDLENLQKIQ